MPLLPPMPLVVVFSYGWVPYPPPPLCGAVPSILLPFRVSPYPRSASFGLFHPSRRLVAAVHAAQRCRCSRSPLGSRLPWRASAAVADRIASGPLQQGDRSRRSSDASRSCLKLHVREPGYLRADIPRSVCPGRRLLGTRGPLSNRCPLLSFTQTLGASEAGGVVVGLGWHAQALASCAPVHLRTQGSAWFGVSMQCLLRMLLCTHDGPARVSVYMATEA